MVTEGLTNARAAPAIDWHAPWWAPLRAAGAPALARWAAGGTVAEALNARGAAPVRFVPQAVLPEGEPYERFIFTQRAVPTRDNLHDFLNGLIWCAYPRAKQALNALQHAEIARDGVRATRGPVRDAVTVFDENGAVLAAPEALWLALAERRWGDLFGPLRPLWNQARLWVLGHAALEKLVSPYKSITAHVLQAPAAIKTMEDVDAWLADGLCAERLVPKPFAPLPLLGVPGWWAPNQDAEFYRDDTVFRPARRLAAVADVDAARRA
ncbi:DUF3025 domain-containing protein [Ottowia testudinis]|uniref:DUF3025 domain-containing protein n=1 Tax=Ottowia testudinis TaxID=2816950 RepID=A0A975CJB2_9BURK|nr:DUF3025 domain-containing protein [Ottowia testudinis]QTD46027.1 DUF3025 domain-containing protein [Ottowia testudinis]